jgi:tetratricopeptide (TPR) repeat protein
MAKFDPNDLMEVRVMHAEFTRDFEGWLALEMSDTLGSYWTIGNLLELTGKKEMAQSYFDTARMEAENAIEENPKDWEFYGELGVSLAKLGKFEEAIEWGKKEVDLMSLTRDRISGVVALEDLAEIYMICGMQDEAIDLYSKILTMPGYLSTTWLKLSPQYDSLREHPRFIALLNKYDSKSDQI